LDQTLVRLDFVFELFGVFSVASWFNVVFVWLHACLLCICLLAGSVLLCCYFPACFVCVIWFGLIFMLVAMRVGRFAWVASFLVCVCAQCFFPVFVVGLEVVKVTRQPVCIFLTLLRAA